MSTYRWHVEVVQAADGKYGARWWADTPSPDPSSNAPAVDGSVMGFELASDARGHAAMWIARYEDALAHSGPPVVVDAQPWIMNDAEIAEALDAYNAQFGQGDVTLKGG